MATPGSIRWPLVMAGAVSFVAAHAVLRAGWPAFDPGGGHRAWFLNSGRAVAFAAAWLLATGWMVGGGVSRGGATAAGAVLAMVIVLFVEGPGTLFPIAIVIGGCVVAGAILAGAMARGRVDS